MSEFLAGVGLDTVSSALSFTAKISGVLILGLSAALLAKPARAAVRHYILLGTFAAVAAVPILMPFLPPISFMVPTVAAGELYGFGETVSSGGRVPGGSAGAVTQSIGLPFAGTVIWLVGTLAFLIPVCAGLWQMRQTRRRAHSWSAIEPRAQALARRAGLKRHVEILLVADIAGPMVFGFRRPAILLPAQATSWSEPDLERGLVHELEHVRRGDWAVQVFARCICALYWFHPLVWICWRELRLQAEQACDDVVLQHSDGPAYAGQLVAVAQEITRGYGHSLLAMAGGRDLSTRIAAILEEGRARGPAGWRIRALLGAAAALLVTVIAPLRVEGVSQVTSFSGPLHGFTEASVRRSRSQEPMTLQPLPGGRLRIVNAPLRILIRAAYGIQDHMIVGAPDWSERFDIVASANRDVTLNEMPSLLRALLEDRFQLRVRSELRQMPVFALRGLPSGPGSGLRPASTHCATARESLPASPTATTVVNPCGFQAGSGTLTGTGVTLRALASSLSNHVGRVVLDQTNSNDYFDFDLSWASDGTSVADSIAASIQGQLGLRLEPAQAEVEVLVIESAERPVEN